MTKKNGTKRSLLMSAVALVLCFSMLVGSTFAWFTDSVTSSGNIIKSGKLDVTMGWADGTEAVPTTDTGWTDASQGAIFDYENWEPGYTVARHIKIANVGTLALKYQLNIIANGEVSELANVIDVYFVDPAQQVVNRAALDSVAPIGTLAEVLAGMPASTSAELLKDESDTVTIALKMQESAGNEYMDKSIGSAFAVQLLATQLTAEEDSFDELYDQNAGYAVEVRTAAALADALRGGGLVRLTDDITVDESMTIPAGVTVNLDLNGKKIEGTKGRDADNNRIHVIVNNGILTIKDGTVKSAGNDGGSAIYNNAGATLTIEDVTLYGAPQSDPVYEAGVSKPFPSYAVNNYGNAVVNGATVKSYHGAIATGGNGVTVINDADIDVGLGQSTGITSYAIYSFENAQVTVNDGKFAFTKQEVYVNGGNTFCELGTNPIIVNGGNYIGTSFSTGAGREYVIKGGTFDKDPSAYVADGYEVVDNGNGTYTVQLSTATGAEIKDQLNDSTTTNVVLGQDVDLDDPAFQSNGNMSLTVKDGKTLDLNNNSVIRPASGSGSGVVIPGGATTTVKNGSIISEGDMTSIDIASGAAATFENMEFVGNGSSFARVRANINAKTTLIFRECSFTNATVEITGMNGACDVDIQFIGCTFEGSYKMYDENGNLLTDPHGNVHYTSELFSAESNYIYGSFTFDDCTFDYDASESRYDRSVIALYGPSASYGKTLTVTLKDVTVTGEKIIPVTVDSRYKASVTIVEEGTNTYTNNGVAVNYDGSTK